MGNVDLEGHRPAEFSAKPEIMSYLYSEDLDYLDQVCLIKFGAKLCRDTGPPGSNAPHPCFNKYSSLVNIINGENLHLDCLSGGQPLPKLTWTLPNGVVLTRPQTTGRYSVLNNGTLTVQRTSVYDRGTYLCQTTNEHGSSSLSVSVIVIAYPPRITKGPSPVTYARPGVAVQLNCVPLATPKAEVVWEMPDSLQLKVGVQPRLYGNKYLHPQGSLVIQNPSSRDNGVYKCTAKNVVGSDSRSTYVYVS